MNCPNNCSGNGKCQSDNTCLCDKGYLGDSCSILDKSGKIKNIDIFLYVLGGIFGSITLALGIYLYIKWYSRK